MSENNIITSSIKQLSETDQNGSQFQPQSSKQELSESKQNNDQISPPFSQANSIDSQKITQISNQNEQGNMMQNTYKNENYANNGYNKNKFGQNLKYNPNFRNGKLNYNEEKDLSNYQSEFKKQYLNENKIDNQNNEFLNNNKFNNNYYKGGSYPQNNTYNAENSNTSYQKNNYNNYKQTQNSIYQKSKKYQTMYIPKNNIQESEKENGEDIKQTEYHNKKDKRNENDQIVTSQEQNEKEQKNQNSNRQENFEEGQKDQSTTQNELNIKRDQENTLSNNNQHEDIKFKNQFKEFDQFEQQIQSKQAFNPQRNKGSVNKLPYQKKVLNNKYTKQQNNYEKNKLNNKMDNSDAYDSLQEEYELSDNQESVSSDAEKTNNEKQGQYSSQNRISYNKSSYYDKQSQLLIHDQRIASKSIDGQYEDRYNQQNPNQKDSFQQTHSQTEMNQGKRNYKNYQNQQNIQNTFNSYKNMNPYPKKQYLYEGETNKNNNGFNNEQFNKKYEKKQQIFSEEEIDEMVQCYLSDEDECQESQQTYKQKEKIYEKLNNKYKKPIEKQIYVLKDKDDMNACSKQIESDQLKQSQKYQNEKIMPTIEKKNNEYNLQFQNKEEISNVEQIENREIKNVSNFYNQSNGKSYTNNKPYKILNNQKNKQFNQNKGEGSEIYVRANQEKEIENYPNNQQKLNYLSNPIGINIERNQSENNQNFKEGQIVNNDNIDTQYQANGNPKQKKYVFVEKNKQSGSNQNNIQSQQREDQTTLKSGSKDENNQLVQNKGESDKANGNKQGPTNIVSEMNKVHPMRQAFISEEDLQVMQDGDQSNPKQNVNKKSKIDRLREKWSNPCQLKGNKQQNNDIPAKNANQFVLNAPQHNQHLSQLNYHQNPLMYQQGINSQINSINYPYQPYSFYEDSENQHFKYFSQSYQSQVYYNPQKLQEYEYFQQPSVQDIYPNQQMNTYSNQVSYPNSYNIENSSFTQPQPQQQQAPQSAQNQTPQAVSSIDVNNRTQFQKSSPSVQPNSVAPSPMQLQKQLKLDQYIQQPISQQVYNLAYLSFFSNYALQQDINVDESIWFYIDNSDNQQGPFSSMQMDLWSVRNYFPIGLKIKFKDGEWQQISQFQQENPIPNEEEELHWIAININDSATITNN